MRGSGACVEPKWVQSNASGNANSLGSEAYKDWKLMQCKYGPHGKRTTNCKASVQKSQLKQTVKVNVFI